MNCDEVMESISLLCDGERITRKAAEHIGACKSCRERMNTYAAIGSELRLLASLEEQQAPATGLWQESKTRKVRWWRPGFTMMRIPRLAFGLMLIAIVVLSGGLAIVRARSGSAGTRFLQLEYKFGAGTSHVCVMRADGSPKDNLCNFVNHGRAGLLLIHTRFIARFGDQAELGIRAKYVSGDGEAEVNYSEALFKDIPEQVLSLQPGASQKLEVAGLGTISVEGEYLDHIHSLFFSPQESLDPGPQEFRIVAPVLLRDKQVLANLDGSSLNTGSPDATLMLYLPGEGRYLISVAPFDGAVKGNVHLGQIAFSLEGHDYLLLTSMPSTLSEHVWVKHEPGFRPSERMVRHSEARDDQALFLVRSLKKLEQPRIEH